MEYLLDSAALIVLIFIALRLYRLPPTVMQEATKTWKEAFVREIREARLENRKLHRAELPEDRRPS